MARLAPATAAGLLLRAFEERDETRVRLLISALRARVVKTPLGAEQRSWKQAMDHLARVHGDRARGLLLEQLKTPDHNFHEQTAVVEALARIGGEGLTHTLIRMLREGGPHRRSAAARVLERLGWRAPSSELRVAMAIGLGNYEEAAKEGAPAEKALRVVAGTHPSPDHRFQAALALASIATIDVPPRVVRFLVKELDEAEAALGREADRQWARCAIDVTRRRMAELMAAPGARFTPQLWRELAKRAG